MTPTPLDEKTRPRWRGDRVVVARRIAIAVGLVVSAILVLLPSGGPSATARVPASTAIADDVAALRGDAEATAARDSAAVASLAEQVSVARDARDAVLDQLHALTGVSYRSVPRALPADTSADLAAAREEHYTDVVDGALRARLASAENRLAAAENAEREAIADYFAALAAAAIEAQAQAQATAAQAAATRAAPPPSSGGGCSGDIGCFLACTRAHESDTAGGYEAVSPDGVYRGAYQFDQTTWNSVADAVGRSDLVGANPAAVSPTDQDTLATALYEVRGNQPWGGRC
jgi:hypothetical protein